MAILQARLERHFYGDVRPPRGVSIERRWWLGYFHFSTNWWNLDFTFWSKWLGGISITWQKIRWVPGWNRFGMLTAFMVIRPFVRLEGNCVLPVIIKHESWKALVNTYEISE